MDLSQAQTGSNDAPTIDEIDVENTPSLVGFWKCYDAVNGRVPDHSGNGFDLYHRCPSELWDDNNVASSFLPRCSDVEGLDEHVRRTALTKIPGFYCLGYGAGLFLDITNIPEINDPNGIFMMASEVKADLTSHPDDPLKNPPASIDFDFGTYWAGNDTSKTDSAYAVHYAPARGFNIAAAFDVALQSTTGWVRFSDGSIQKLLGGGAAESYTDKDIVTQQFYYSNPDGAYAVQATNLDIVRKLTVTDFSEYPSSLPPQTMDTGVPYFALRCQNGWPQTFGVRNVQLWKFDSHQPLYKESVEFLAKNPGRIPPWLVGK